ncbi:erythromycin esterase family protein [Bailinhaonella thermotolerans]|uniref:Erythromycin esterase family protein n=1 Tax=Bailinhaonella thermotolerans TaxID=1070861 RepID=A0A3A4AZW2_9ACTN|nr:erythromycin esterase family protein [Bailinhaonella thermotolerans]
MAAARTAADGDVVRWIDANAVRPARIDAEGPVDDLGALRRIVGGAKVVGLGEPSHGAHEQVTVRHRVIRYLVERMGFRTVAWEESWGSGVAVDRYVVSGEGDAREVVSRMGFQWRGEAMLGLVRWMREFNRGRPAHDRVRFVGADVMELRAIPFDEVTRYVRDVAPGRLAELRRHLDPIAYRGTPEDHFRWYFGQSEEARKGFAEDARAVVALVTSLPEGPSRIGREDAVRHARSILGFYESYVERLEDVAAPVRDRHIARILTEWQGRTGHRVAYGAANVHTTASPRVTWRFPPDPVPKEDKTMAGGHLRAHYGRSYVSIGTVSHAGRILGGWENGPPSVFTVPPPGPALVDHTLGQARHRDYLLDLRAKAPEPVRRWLRGPATMRIIGTAYDVARDADYTMRVPSWSAGFDAVLHLAATTPTRLLPR